MFDTLPGSAQTAMDWNWEQFAPYYDYLLAQEVTEENVAGWLAQWSQLDNLVVEVNGRLRLAFDKDTTDAQAEGRYFDFLENVMPPAKEKRQELKKKLLQSDNALERMDGLGMATPMRKMRAEAELFRKENLQLSVELDKLGSRYQKIVGSQTVQWEGEELTIPQLRPHLNNPDRSVREQVWRLAHERRLADRSALNGLWQEMLPLRRKMARNAGCDDFREFQWKEYHRFDYTPADAQMFHEAIAEICVPAATRIFKRHRRRLGLATLRPWDLSDGEHSIPVNGPDAPLLIPYEDADEFLAKSGALFQQVDPQLGAHFQTMVSEELLDVENRAGKAPGGYCTYFPAAKRPFIFMNAVGLHDDVQTMMHEAGHAFHAFAAGDLPYRPQRFSPMEFNEVASMAMELLAAPYLAGNGDAPAFYGPEDAARARLEHLEEMILFWPYMAVVDAFQHWAYTHADEATDPNACDAQWSELWAHFLPGIDWSGLDDFVATGWHRKLHIFEVPFYYVEYGIAALGAGQVWMNAQQDQAQALARYREALALGGTAPLPELFAKAGARFAFDGEAVGEVVSFLEGKIDELEESIAAA